MPFAGFWESDMHLVIAGPAYPIRGGIAQSVTQLYKTLDDAGHDVHVLSFRRLYPALFFPGKTLYETGKALYEVRSRALIDSVNPWTWIRALFWLRTLQPDALIFQYWMPFFLPCYAFLAFFMKTFWNVRIIFMCHNVLSHERFLGDRILIKAGFKFSDGIITQSDSVRQALMRLHPNQHAVNVPHPTYTLLPPPVSRQQARKALGIRAERLILYFGMIRGYKGVRYLVKAMPLILEQIPAQCLICGEFYEEREETRTLIRELNLDAHVRVTDRFIPNESVHLYFCAADIVALPYVAATQSGVVQVAYNYNRPVVVTRVGGLPEAVIEGKTGYVVPPEDPAAIANAALRFFRERRNIPFEKYIESEKQNYSWARMAEAVEKLTTRKRLSI